MIEALHDIGIVYLLKGDYSQSLAFEQRALKPAEAMGNNELLGEILQNISECYLRPGQYQPASEYAERAAVLAQSIRHPRNLVEGAERWPAKRTSHLISRTSRAKNFLESIATIEKLRGESPAVSRNSNASSKTRLRLTRRWSNSRWRRTITAEALIYAERAKGRVLLDVLNSGRANITKAMTE